MKRSQNSPGDFFRCRGCLNKRGRETSGLGDGLVQDVKDSIAGRRTQKTSVQAKQKKLYHDKGGSSRGGEGSQVPY